MSTHTWTLKTCTQTLRHAHQAHVRTQSSLVSQRTPESTLLPQLFNSSWTVVSSPGNRPIGLRVGMLLELGLPSGWSPGAPIAETPAPSSHQLLHLAALCSSPAPLAGKDSRLISCSITAAHSLEQACPMADPGLNHSWPAFSKLWLKPWAFKRGKRAGSEQQAQASRQGSLDNLPSVPP